MKYTKFSHEIKQLSNSNVVSSFNILQQKDGDDLSVCVLNILPKVSSLPSLLAINLVKVEI